MFAGIALLTLALFLPLLSGGRLLLLDWVPGPHVPLSRRFWGFPEGAPLSSAPIEGLFYLLNRVAGWAFLSALPLLLSPPLAALGFWCLFGPRPVAVLGSTLFLMVNPFMYDRMLAGHVYFVLGVALLPLLFSQLVRQPTARTTLTTGLLLALLVALSVHFAFIAGALVVIAATARLASREYKPSVMTLSSLGVAAILSVYWLLPIALTSVGAPRELSPAHLEAFRTLPDSRFGLFPNLVGLYGFWRAEWPSTKQHIPTWPVILAALLLIIAIAIRELTRSQASRFVAWILVLGGLVGLLLAAGNQGPTGGLFEWAFNHLPGFAAMRESQKFLALLVLAYAVGFGWGVQLLAAQASSKNAKVALTVVLLMLPVAYGLRGVWGFAGFARPSHAPESWMAADRIMGEGSGKVWALPWHQYLQIPWAQGRVLHNPMDSFFRRDVIVSTDPEVPGIAAVDQSDVQRYLDLVVRRGSDETQVGRLLAPLGIEYVLLAEVADYRSYSWIAKQQDLRVVRKWSDLVLLENESAIGDEAFVPDGAVSAPTWEAAMDWARKESLLNWAITVDPREKEREVRPPSSSPAPVDVRPRSPVRAEVVGGIPTGPLVTFLTPSDGWEYQGVKPTPNLGLTAAFRVDGVDPGPISYKPWDKVRLGYAVGGAALLLIIVALRATASWTRHPIQDDKDMPFSAEGT